MLHVSHKNKGFRLVIALAFLLIAVTVSNAATVAVALTAPTDTTVSQGDKLGPFTASITNNSGSKATFLVYAYVWAPDGSATSVVSGKTISLRPYKTISKSDLYYDVSSTAQAGTYSYYMAAYDTKYNLIDDGYFWFTVAATSTTDLVSENIDWRPQDYYDSQGITNVTYDSTSDKLMLSCNLKGQDDQISNGEIVLDLKYVTTIESHVPIDMTDKTITVDVEVPSGFIGPSSSPNGIQIFVKDNSENWLSQYGTWTNITSSGKVTLTFKPSTVNPDNGETATGFDPTKIRTIGLKFGINSTSTHEFNGDIYISKFEVSPALPSTPLPVMPEGTPVSFVNNESAISLEADGFYSGGKKWFVVGGNWRLIEYGQNFGATAWFPNGNGASMHSGYISTRLKLFRDAGVTLIRVGLLDDGRTMFDIDGNIIGYDEKFREDVSTLLDLAAENNIKVEFVLLDFLVAGKEEDVVGVWVRGRREIIEDQTKRTQFITNFLEPFLTEFGSHSALFGFDLMNEPEWIISSTEGGGWEGVEDTDTSKDTTPVSLADVNSYFNECINTIRQFTPDKFITVGVSIKFINLVTDLDLDYMALHYYDWMGNLNDLISGIPESKVWLLEEYPGGGKNGGISISSYLNTVYNASGHGALLWNLSPEIDDYTYTFEEEEGKLLEVREFVDETDDDL